MTWRKLAESLGSALPDSVKSTAAATPLAPVAVENKPAPGRLGPRGLSPRTTYSRVNTGSAPTTSYGGEQKATAPRGMEFLPQKVAHRRDSTMGSIMQRPLLQDLVKSAMEATVAKANVAVEAHRQLGIPIAKTAAAKSSTPHIPSEVCEKYASALEYLAKKADIDLSGGTPGIGPGEGPNALEVTQAPGGENPFDAGTTGSATAPNQVPVNPPMASFPDSKAPANAMATNLDMEHGEQPVDPMNNETASNEAQKTSAVKLARKNLGLLKKLSAGLPTDLTPEEEARVHQAMLTGGIGGGIPFPGADALGGGLTEGWRGAGHAFLGSGIGEVGGATLGAGVGALGGAALGNPEVGAALGGRVGAIAGGAAGGAYGNRLAALKNIRDERAAAPVAVPKEAAAKKTAALHAKNLAALGLRKQAEDALNPAQISAGPASAEGAEAPMGVSASEEGPVPAVPSDVSRQESFIGSNEAAIAYTKRQAKMDPKSDLGQLLVEPALSSATDKALELAFAHTNEAGAKVAHTLFGQLAQKQAAAKPAPVKQAAARQAPAKPAVKRASAKPKPPTAASRLTKTAAAHALLLKLAEEVGKEKKVKTSNFSTAQGQSSFDASTTAPTALKAPSFSAR